MFLNFSETKIEKVTYSWFWANLGHFSVLLVFESFIQFFGKFSAQMTRTNLLNLWIFFDFKNYQPVLKYHARKVKFRRFACTKIGNERFAAKNCDYFFIFRMFSKQKNISLNSIQSAEFGEFIFFKKKSKTSKLGKWQKCSFCAWDFTWNANQNWKWEQISNSNWLITTLSA